MSLDNSVHKSLHGIKFIMLKGTLIWYNCFLTRLSNKLLQKK